MSFCKEGLKWALILIAPLAFLGCEKDSAVTGTGNLRIEMTDAPVDDAQVSGVFVTVSKVYIDGKLWEGMTGSQTIELTALQNGNVQSMGIADIDAKAYNQMSVVLDLDHDANGASPGCYVMTKDSKKHDLAASTASELTVDITGPEFEVANDNTTTMVVDFDLRKALRYGNPNELSSNYAFGTSAEMRAAMRIVSKDRSGAIQGHCMDPISTSDKIIVYAYVKGTFNRTEEMSGAADEQFTHAVTSAAVNAQGNYKLSFLEPGEYELIFASYEDEGNNGTLDLQGTLSLQALLDPGAVTVGTASTVTLDITVTGLLP